VSEIHYNKKRSCACKLLFQVTDSFRSGNPSSSLLSSMDDRLIAYVRSLVVSYCQQVFIYSVLIPVVSFLKHPLSSKIATS
jgi:hypothetical protein